MSFWFWFFFFGYHWQEWAVSLGTSWLYVITNSHVPFFSVLFHSTISNFLPSFQMRTSASCFHPPHFPAPWHAPLYHSPTLFSCSFPHIPGALLHSPRQEWCSLSCFASLSSAVVTNGISRAGTMERTAWGRTERVIWLSQVVKELKGSSEVVYNQNTEKKYSFH